MPLADSFPSKFLGHFRIAVLQSTGRNFAAAQIDRSLLECPRSRVPQIATVGHSITMRLRIIALLAVTRMRIGGANIDNRQPRQLLAHMLLRGNG